MNDTVTRLGDELDLSQFHGVFFEEAAENLEAMERLLLEVDIEAADDEQLNAIFRCAHSVKGGAATFGFADVAELTHEMETLLDRLRRRELAAAPAMVDVLLRSGDALRALLDRHRDGGGEDVATAGLVDELRSLAAGAATAPGAAPASPAPGPSTVAERMPAAAAASSPQPVADPAARDADGQRRLELTVGPLHDTRLADGLQELFREVVDLGRIEPLDAGVAADGYRRFQVCTASSDEDLLDLFGFHVDRSLVRIAPLGPGYGFHPGAPGAPVDDDTRRAARVQAQEASGQRVTVGDDAGFGLFDDAPGAPPREAAPPAPAAVLDESTAVGATDAGSTARARPKATAGGTADGTLRVAVDKVDQLINLVGELVITQAVLAQRSATLDPALHQQLASGLADLERNTRDLQESVMSIRMIPMSLVFNRFPRMLRELAARLGKKVEFVTQGETTELDKGMVEKITDPLTHLVRNSCDHGIEPAAERLARGKPGHGTITLAASHQGGNIVIEVRDDGRGLNRARLLAKARERGLDAPDTLSDAEVWNLIFAPGFSTAEQVTDVSGRGVGMDVVKKNITALGGTVDVDSAEGLGMTVRVRLPLTLAILEGMTVRVGGECYVLPLASVVESFQPSPQRVSTVAGERVVRVRDEYLPVVELERIFGIPRPPGAVAPDPLMVVLEADDRRVAAIVDELVGQQQVVVKNLETNYRRVDHVSGATIMGDGRVALIIDVGAIVAGACRRGGAPAAAAILSGVPA